jgi:aconitate hydratase
MEGSGHHWAKGKEMQNSFGTLGSLHAGAEQYQIFRLEALEKAGVGNVSRLPFCLKVLLENLLRNEDGRFVKRDDIEKLARWNPAADSQNEIAFMPARVLLQDFTGVPAVADLAAMRDAIAALGGDPAKINPLQPAELVIDHSVQVDYFGTRDAFQQNARLEFERNQERYMFLRWAQKAFRNFAVVPPDTGIVHQVNLEYLARVVFRSKMNGKPVAYPDTLVGTDSHTTMINGLGVVGWGVGGIEAEAALLGQPITMLIPPVVGFKLTGALPPGATATDLVLTVTEILRKHKVVGKFVEFYGPGLSQLPLADRATLGNMCPEYGATIAIFPIDEETLKYLRFSGRDEAAVELVRAYATEQGLFRAEGSSDSAAFTEQVQLDLSTVEPCLAGPRRPQDRVPLRLAKQSFAEALPTLLGKRTDATPRSAPVAFNGTQADIGDGSVVIAAITSCTNTSNPSVMLGAGLLAKKAVEKGLKTPPWVKTSLAPGSKVVTDYLNRAGLTPYLEKLGFHLVGYGCTTCIGNSGPLPEPVSKAIRESELVAAAVLSGNRNFEGRIQSQVRANYLASPPLVVAYALAGRMDIDLAKDPVGRTNGGAIYLRDIWPSEQEVQEAVRSAVGSEMFRRQYSDVFSGDDSWRSLAVPGGDRFVWDAKSTYVRRPPFFDNLQRTPGAAQDVRGARVLAMLGDSVTTDHISPAGSIPSDSPAGKYLISHGVQPKDFNSYGARRGNHEVMIRGTFANIRLRNLLVLGTEGGVTVHLPDGENMTIFDASAKYQQEGVPLLILAGKEYGSGSSRDWAAKGPRLLGVRAVIAESFERIHRSNLVGMGVLPLEFQPGETAAGLCLTGREIYDVEDIGKALASDKKITVRARDDKGKTVRFTTRARIDTPEEVLYYQHGGILPYVLRQLL